MSHIVIFGMRVLETLFFVGLAGSAVVVAISFVEDFGVLFQRDRPRAEAPGQSGTGREFSQPTGSRRVESGAAASRV